MWICVFVHVYAYFFVMVCDSTWTCKYMNQTWIRCLWACEWMDKTVVYDIYMNLYQCTYELMLTYKYVQIYKWVWSISMCTYMNEYMTLNVCLYVYICICVPGAKKDWAEKYKLKMYKTSTPQGVKLWPPNSFFPQLIPPSMWFLSRKRVREPTAWNFLHIYCVHILPSFPHFCEPPKEKVITFTAQRNWDEIKENKVFSQGHQIGTQCDLFWTSKMHSGSHQSCKKEIPPSQEGSSMMICSSLFPWKLWVSLKALRHSVFPHYSSFAPPIPHRSTWCTETEPNKCHLSNSLAPWFLIGLHW